MMQKVMPHTQNRLLPQDEALQLAKAQASEARAEADISAQEAGEARRRADAAEARCGELLEARARARRGSERAAAEAAAEASSLRAEAAALRVRNTLA